jgi:hypothetical protein
MIVKGKKEDSSFPELRSSNVTDNRLDKDLSSASFHLQGMPRIARFAPARRTCDIGAQGSRVAAAKETKTFPAARSKFGSITRGVGRDVRIARSFRCNVRRGRR